MSGKTMDERVTDLEKLAESLAPLPVRMEAVEGRLGDVDMRLGAVETRLGTVESQIVQLRTEMRVEFSAVTPRDGRWLRCRQVEMADGCTAARAIARVVGLRVELAADSRQGR